MINKDFNKKIINYFNWGMLDSRFNNLDKVDINDGDTVIDCGAHLGDTTIYLSNRVGEYGKVISIEADRLNFRQLRLNINNFNLKNVKLINKGISNIKGDGYIYISKYSSAHSLIKNSIKVDGDNRRMIKCDKLTNIIRDLELDKIDFIWLNIEGSEYLILDQLIELLNKYKPKICVHDHAKYLKNHNSKELYDMFSECGYTKDKYVDMLWNATNDEFMEK